MRLRFTLRRALPPATLAGVLSLVFAAAALAAPPRLGFRAVLFPGDALVDGNELLTFCLVNEGAEGELVDGDKFDVQLPVGPGDDDLVVDGLGAGCVSEPEWNCTVTTGPSALVYTLEPAMPPLEVQEASTVCFEFTNVDVNSFEGRPDVTVVQEVGGASEFLNPTLPVFKTFRPSLQHGEPAGGELIGTYPNPEVADSVIDLDNLTFDTATQAELNAEESARIAADEAHAAIPDVHHVKTTTFDELTDTATDDQIPNDITIDFAATAGDADTVDGRHAADLWQRSGNAGTTPGTDFVGTTDATALQLHVDGERALRIEPADTPNLIGGHASNSTPPGTSGVIIAGGGSDTDANRVTGSCLYCTISGGEGNQVSGRAPTVGGGARNAAPNSWATVSGGHDNRASGNGAVVPGGRDNEATGSYSLAAGSSAKALHEGSFVWADRFGPPFETTGNNQFIVRATGGVGIGTNSPDADLDVNGTARMNGFELPAGSVDGHVLTADATGRGTWQPTQETHEKTTSFSELIDTASDAQIPNDITIDFSAAAGNADTTDGYHAVDLLNSSLGFDGATLVVTDGGGAKTTDLTSLEESDEVAALAADLAAHEAADQDLSASNELNASLSFDGAILGVTDAGGTQTTDLSGLEDSAEAAAAQADIDAHVAADQDLDPENELQSWPLPGTPAGFADDTDDVNDADADPGNEYNTGLTLDGTSLIVTDLGTTFSASLASLEESDEVAAEEARAMQAEAYRWALGGNAGTNSNSHYVGTSDMEPLELRVNGSRALRLAPTDYGPPNVIGGDASNAVSQDRVSNGRFDISSATIGGGARNRITDVGDTISGGWDNVTGDDDGTAEVSFSVIAGGVGNRASGYRAVVGGGRFNVAAAQHEPTVAGGDENAATGDYSAIPGGRLNAASGPYAFAAGRQAKAAHGGTFVWADRGGTLGEDFSSTGPDQFLVRANGGVGIGTSSPAAQLDVAGTTRTAGLELPTGAVEGHVLTSDAAGVATWQPPPAGSGAQLGYNKCRTSHATPLPVDASTWIEWDDCEAVDGLTPLGGPRTTHFRAEEAGVWAISAMAETSRSTAWAIGSSVRLEVWNHDSLAERLAFHEMSGVGDGQGYFFGPSGSTVLSLAAGDVLTIRVRHTGSASTQTLDGDPASNHVSFHRLR